MPNFTQAQQDQLRLILGYASTPNLLTTELSEQRTQPVITRAIAILAELADIDQKLIDARSDSMAEQVGSLKLSYGKHVLHMKAEGARLLGELSSILGIAISYNKYGGSTLFSRSYW